MIPQVVCGIFYTPEFFKKAEKEFTWSIKQNRDFWKSAVLYLDKESANRLLDCSSAFREVVVDEQLPDIIKQKPKWNCKGWWAKKAIDRFDRILFCDFDIYVRRPLDAFLGNILNHSPKFLDIPDYQSSNKIVGCGCVYYDRRCDWDNFLDLLYNKWNCDERAWTETLQMTRNKLIEEDLHMNPYIVDQSWLLRNPQRREDVYIIHGISPWDDGLERLRRIGYAKEEIHFVRSVSFVLRDVFLALIKHLGTLKRRLSKKRTL